MVYSRSRQSPRRLRIVNKRRNTGFVSRRRPAFDSRTDWRGRAIGAATAVQIEHFVLPPRLRSVCIALCIVACNRSPTAPTPIVPFTETTPAFMLCAIGRSCDFTGQIGNDGNACAIAMRRIMTFLDGGQSVAAFEWALAPGQIVRPLEVVEIRVTDIPYAATEGTVDASTQRRGRKRPAEAHRQPTTPTCRQLIAVGYRLAGNGAILVAHGNATLDPRSELDGRKSQVCSSARYAGHSWGRSLAAERRHGIDRSGAASRDDARKDRPRSEGRT